HHQPSSQTHCTCVYFLLSYSTIHCIFFNAPSTTEIYTLSLHDALPIYSQDTMSKQSLTESLLEDSEIAELRLRATQSEFLRLGRSEEHTSELQSPDHLVCRLLLEKKKKKTI